MSKDQVWKIISLFYTNRPKIFFQAGKWPNFLHTFFRLRRNPVIMHVVSCRTATANDRPRDWKFTKYAHNKLLLFEGRGDVAWMVSWNILRNVDKKIHWRPQKMYHVTHKRFFLSCTTQGLLASLSGYDEAWQVSLSARSCQKWAVHEVMRCMNWSRHQIHTGLLCSTRQPFLDGSADATEATVCCIVKQALQRVETDSGHSFVKTWVVFW